MSIATQVLFSFPLAWSAFFHPLHFQSVCVFRTDLSLVLHPFSHFDCVAFTLSTFIVIDDYVFISICSLFFFGCFCSSCFFFCSLSLWFNDHPQCYVSTPFFLFPFLACVSVIDYWFVVTVRFIYNYTFINVYDYVGDHLQCILKLCNFTPLCGVHVPFFYCRTKYGGMLVCRGWPLSLLAASLWHQVLVTY